MNFGTWLKQTRDEKGVSGVELEKKTGISRQYISNLERGSKTDKNGNLIRPSRDKVIALAKALRANTDEALTIAGYASESQSPQFSPEINELLTKLRAKIAAQPETEQAKIEAEFKTLLLFLDSKN